MFTETSLVSSNNSIHILITILKKWNQQTIAHQLIKSSSSIVGYVELKFLKKWVGPMPIRTQLLK